MSVENAAAENGIGCGSTCRNFSKSNVGNTINVKSRAGRVFYLPALLCTILVQDGKEGDGEYIASHAPYGYIKDPENKHKLIPDPVAAPVVQRIFALAVSGKNLGQIARILNEEHVETPAAHFARIHPESRKHKKRSPKQDWGSYSVRNIIERLEYTGANVSYKRDYKSLNHPTSNKKDNENTGLQYADRISQSRDTGKTRDFISSLTGQSKTEIHRELESYNKEREHL